MAASPPVPHPSPRWRLLYVMAAFLACRVSPPPPAMATTVVLTRSIDAAEDDRERIQDALDAVEKDGGGTVHVMGGPYYIGDGGTGVQGLLIPSNVHLKMDRDAVLYRRTKSTGEQYATIRNKHQSGDPGFNENIRVSGGTIPSLNSEMEGRHLGFVNTRYLTVDNVRFRAVYGDWNASFKNCEDVIVTDLVIRSGAELHEDGLHFTAGRRIIVADCDIESGDDCIALVYDATELADPSELADVSISNCVLFSHAANALKILVAAPGGEPLDPPPAGPVIRRVTVANVVAKCGDEQTDPDLNKGGGIEIADYNNQLRISDVDVSNFQLDASQGTHQPLTIRGAERVRLSQVTFRDPLLRSTIDASNDVSLLDCTIDLRTGATASQQCLLAGDSGGPCTNIRIVGGQYRKATQHAIQMGAAQAVTGFEVSNALIDDAANNGITIYDATDGLVSGNRIINCGGYGVQEVSPSDDNLYIGNYLVDNLVGLTNEGSGSYGVRNVAPGRNVKDSGGFRGTADGWYNAGVLQATQANVELARGPGQIVGRFRAARAGSVTGVVVSSTDAPSGMGTLSVTVYKNTGAAGATTGLTNLFLTATLNQGGTTDRAYTTQREGLDPFEAGDELLLLMSTNGWAPTTANVRAAIEYAH